MVDTAIDKATQAQSTVSNSMPVLCELHTRALTKHAVDGNAAAWRLPFHLQLSLCSVSLLPSLIHPPHHQPLTSVRPPTMARPSGQPSADAAACRASRATLGKG